MSSDDRIHSEAVSAVNDVRSYWLSDYLSPQRGRVIADAVIEAVTSHIERRAVRRELESLLREIEASHDLGIGAAWHLVDVRLTTLGDTETTDDA